MSYFGVESVLVADVSTSGRSDLDLIMDAVGLLQQRVPDNQLPNQRGILRFPRREYHIDRPTSASAGIPYEYDFPAGIFLQFDPGAILVLGEGVILGIQSILDVDRQQIFRTPSVLNRSMPRYPFGFVLLLGSIHKRVLPEWWGAASSPDGDDTNALQSAIYAAHTDRVYHPQPISNPPIPLELKGQYRITRSLKITYNHQLEEERALMQPMPSQSFSPGAPPFIIRGQRTTESAGQKPVLLWVGPADPPSPEAMIWSNGSNGLQVQNISMDGQLRVAECLHVQSPASAAESIGGSAQMILIRECSFRDATQALLHIGDTVYGTQDLPGLMVQHCLFKVSHVETAPINDPFRVPGVVGIRLNATEAVEVRFQDCVFTGQSAAFIHAYAGIFTAEGCVFSNRYMPRMIERRMRYGCDVLLDRHILPDIPVQPASMVAIDCESSSVQFLDTYVYRRADVPVKTSPSVAHSMIINLKHRRFMAVPTDVPAIFWGQRLVSASGLPPAFTLTLLGCWLDGNVHIPNIDPTSIGLIDLGTSFTVDGHNFWFTDPEGMNPVMTNRFWSFSNMNVRVS